jgi:hypothetical protein
MPDEDMHEAQRRTRSKLRVRMRVRLRKRRLNSKIHLRVSRIQMYFQEAHLISLY